MKVTVPFLQQPLGAGDLVKKVAATVGIQQKQGCGCQKRQEALNRALSFVPPGPPVK